MADLSVIANFVPLVGLNNILTAVDTSGDSGINPLEVPMVTQGPSWVPKNSVGSGDSPSPMVTDPEGRVGSSRTVLLLNFDADFDVDSSGDTFIMGLAVKLPNMQGVLSPENQTPAEAADSNNFPNLDPSKFYPALSVTPHATGLYANQQTPVEASTWEPGGSAQGIYGGTISSVFLDPAISMGFGITYFSKAALNQSDLFGPGVDISDNLAPFGAMFIGLIATAAAPAVIAEGTILQVSVDFLHTTVN